MRDDVPSESSTEPISVRNGRGRESVDAALIAFAQRLVATPSLPEEELPVAELVAAELRRLGYHDVEIDEHGNVTGVFGQGPPRLMFNGHTDHVPPADMKDPYGATIEDGAPYGAAGQVLRGRGSSDMKANVAAGAYAVAYLEEDLGGSYVFTADVQEETDAPVGIQALLARGLTADYGISGEPTRLRVSLGHRGKIQVDVTVHGRASHASTPQDGINAIFRARPFLDALEGSAADLPRDDFFGPATLTVTGIRSLPEEDVAVVPHACILRVDRRYIPGETPEGCLGELEDLVERVAAEHGTPTEVALVNVYPLMSIAEDHPLVRAAQAAGGRELMAWRFGVNATFMSAAGIPTIGMGPGSEDVAHTDQEHVPIDEVIHSSQATARLLSALCRGGDRV